VALGCWYGDALNPAREQRQMANVVAMAMRDYRLR
jgi:hypothetical protein